MSKSQFNKTKLELLFRKSKGRYLTIGMISFLVFLFLIKFTELGNLTRLSNKLFIVWLFSVTLLATYTFESFCEMVASFFINKKLVFREYLKLFLMVFIGIFIISILFSWLTGIVLYPIDDVLVSVWDNLFYFLIPGYVFSFVLTFFALDVGQRNRNFDDLEKEDFTETEKQAHFTFRSAKKFYLKSYNEIVYLNSVRNNTLVVTEDEEYEAMMSLKAAIDELPETQFLRVHKSFVVNRDFIEYIEREGGGYRLQLSDFNHSVVPVGRKYNVELIDKFKLKSV